jgi:hypothetical protein
MARELKLWNGRHPNGRGSVYAAGYTKKQVIEMLELAYPTGGNINSWNRELDIYWSKCWGNSMDGITPEVGVWEQGEKFGSPVMRVVFDGKVVREKVPAKQTTDDEVVFGKDEWVYCAQHLRPHKTGWCTVGIMDKVALGVDNEKDAYAKCERLGLKIFKG